VNFIVADGRLLRRSEQPSANFRMVGPEFFATLELQVQRGRAFGSDERDPARPMPAVISKPVAERLWPGEDAIGKGFSRGIQGEPGFEVVGVTADARTTSLEQAPPLMVYVPYWWRSRSSTSLLVKAATEPRAIMPEIRRVIREIDPEIAIGDARTMTAIVDAATAGRRYQAQLFIAFGLIALAVAALGVYAVTAYSLSRRRAEMNIRVALGARPLDVFGMIIRQSSVAIIAGALAGVAGALASGGVVASLLYDVRARDPWIIGATASMVAAIGLAAAAIAARSGLSIDPVAALREN
jgi:hypothetical protein